MGKGRQLQFQPGEGLLPMECVHGGVGCSGSQQGPDPNAWMCSGAFWTHLPHFQPKQEDIPWDFCPSSRSSWWKGLFWDWINYPVSKAVSGCDDSCGPLPAQDILSHFAWTNIFISKKVSRTKMLRLQVQEPWSFAGRNAHFSDNHFPHLFIKNSMTL